MSSNTTQGVATHLAIKQKPSGTQCLPTPQSNKSISFLLRTQSSSKSRSLPKPSSIPAVNLQVFKSSIIKQRPLAKHWTLILNYLYRIYIIYNFAFYLFLISSFCTRSAFQHAEYGVYLFYTPILEFLV